MSEELLADGLKFLKAETLHMVDGGSVALLIDRELKEALMDCHDRPWINKPRKITLQIAITPDYNQPRDVIDDFDVDITVKGMHPTKGTLVKMSPGRHGGLVFSRDCSDNPRQKSLLNDEE